ncbi:NACHT domain-containing protein [Streptomyces spectabilis]|uniref:Energy-coupling factor transporter ATP-binding protein EcfA2 n=1 Tax=Streptomyces spectabilis TaxID=68270 RepID=A0A5P2X8P0_STRST|nr:NACHT domain-containing protein [Streptomyces spectabilis]MBB5103516.1 energy-coupling factor transporter ATP-binding protein EcfA2 [Streptomyces spectabilis]MCI3904238.1 NACHT domain-containing protein [Streptomyces spectabilis]QEV61357.1 NACHT domain-containing protein [Streptomyces spectabilis]GGV20335.1 ATP-binding protein [Streptomyces spectabilis]
MDPLLLGTRLASSALTPLVRKLFVREGPGAGLADRPVRLSALVSFRGEKRALDERDVRKLAGQLVRRAVESPGEPPFPADEETAVTDALASRLLALGDLDMDDVQAVRLGHRTLARKLHTHAPGLSTDATVFLDSVTEWACVHILHFFTQRSTFTARTLVEQSRSQAELIVKIDELIRRNPRPSAQDASFERRYLPYVADKHNHLTIYGIDLRESPDRWPLEVAYLTLEATTYEEYSVGDHMGAALVTVPLSAAATFTGRPRVLLRGEAGSGKTTLVQWLAVSAAHEGTRVPFVLPLRTLVRAPALPGPGAFLTAVSCPLGAPDGWAERVLAAGRGLVMVDGIDEVPAADRARTRDWLLDLTRAYPDNRWLVTTRPTAVRPTWLAEQGFHELTLAPMKRADVATFVRRWHTAADARDYEDRLLTALRGKRDLARMATNPLMCGLMCALHRERRGFLPQGRKELYDAALSMLLTRRDRERGMGGTADGIELGEEAKLELLQSLAYSLILSGRTEMDQDGAVLLLERALPTVASAAAQGDADAVFRHLLLRSGLLREPGPGVVDFVHRTFQDYLGARAAVSDGHLDALVSHAGDTGWEDVIRMAVAHARPRERAALLRKLLAADGSARVGLLALACLEDATTLDPAVHKEVETRAAGLIPPRTAAEARVLAEAGPLALELLPGPEGLSDDEALGVVVTAGLVGDEFALPVLKRFRTHADTRVCSQLNSAWIQFDTEEYADEVLAHVSPDELYFTARSRAQAQALRRIGPFARMSISGAYTAEELLAFVDPDVLTRLTVFDNPMLNDLSPFTRLRRLRQLTVSNCPTPIDLAPMASLALERLYLRGTGNADSIRGLKQLRTLRVLGINYTLNGDDLTASLPTGAPLENLSLYDGALGTSGLRGLGRWPTLTYLMLAMGECEPTSADFEELAAHPSLDELLLEPPVLPYLQEAPELPRIATLRLFPLYGTEDLSHLPRVFPGVREVVITPAGQRYFPADRYEGLFPHARVEVRKTFWNTSTS